MADKQHRRLPVPSEQPLNRLPISADSFRLLAAVLLRDVVAARSAIGCGETDRADGALASLEVLLRGYAGEPEPGRNTGGWPAARS